MNYCTAITRTHAWPLLAAIAICLTSASATAQTPTPVTECGQHVTDGILMQDLQCDPGYAQSAVVVSRSLDLNGFTLDSERNAIRCADDCEITGPGTLTDSTHNVGTSVWGTSKYRRGTAKDVTLRNVTVVDSGLAVSGARIRIEDSQIINSSYCAATRVDKGQIDFIRSKCLNARIRGIRPSAKTRIVDSEISGAALEGIGGSNVGRVTIENSIIRDNGGTGVEADQVRAFDSEITGNAHGILWRGKLKATSEITNTVIADNAGRGISMFRTSRGRWFGKVRVTNSEIVRNGDVGVYTSNATVTDSTISDNGGDGIFTATARIRNSSISRNGEHGICAQKQVQAVNTSVTDNVGVGIVATGVYNVFEGRPGKIDLRDGSTVEGNGLEGVFSDAVKLKESAVAANCTSATALCADIISCSEPRLHSEATCGSSLDCEEPPASWGVCQ